MTVLGCASWLLADLEPNETPTPQATPAASVSAVTADLTCPGAAEQSKGTAAENTGDAT